MKTFKMLLLAIAALCVTACENDEAAYIGVPESIELSADASIIDFVVNSNSNWTLTVSDPWIKITPKHGSGKTTLKLGTTFIFFMTKEMMKLLHLENKKIHYKTNERTFRSARKKAACRFFANTYYCCKEPCN